MFLHTVVCVCMRVSRLLLCVSICTNKSKNTASNSDLASVLLAVAVCWTAVFVRSGVLDDDGGVSAHRRCVRRRRLCLYSLTLTAQGV